MKPLNIAWLLPPVALGLYYTHWPVAQALDGVLLIVAGLAVALDVGGISARIPPVLAWTFLSRDRSPATTRSTFALVAVGGLLMLLYALTRLQA